MKTFHAFSFFLVLLTLSALAQEKSKKTMVFQPGAKVPDGRPPAPAAVAAPAASVPAAPATDMGSTEAPATMAARFFALLQKNDVEGAYEGLTKGSKIAERPEESKALRNKTREAIDVFGSVIGFEMIESKAIGERLLRRTYLSLGKEFPLRWRFYFYKPDLAWRLVDLRVDDRLTGIFEEPEEPRSETKP